MKGKWHTVLLNINWTDQEDGKIKLWLNDQLIYRFEGKTISKIVKNKNEYQMGPKFRTCIVRVKMVIKLCTMKE